MSVPYPSDTRCVWTDRQRRTCSPLPPSPRQVQRERASGKHKVTEREREAWRDPQNKMPNPRESNTSVPWLLEPASRVRACVPPFCVEAGCPPGRVLGNWSELCANANGEYS